MISEINGAYILSVLREITAPATVKDISRLVASYEGKPPRFVRQRVEEVLESGVKSGFIQKTNDHYYCLMHVADVFNDLKSDDDEHGQEPRVVAHTPETLTSDVLQWIRSPTDKKIRSASATKPKDNQDDINLDDLTSELKTVSSPKASRRRRPSNKTCLDTLKDDDDDPINEIDVDCIAHKVSQNRSRKRASDSQGCDDNGPKRIYQNLLFLSRTVKSKALQSKNSSKKAASRTKKWLSMCNNKIEKNEKNLVSLLPPKSDSADSLNKEESQNEDYNNDVGFSGNILPKRLCRTEESTTSLRSISAISFAGSEVDSTNELNESGSSKGSF